MKRLNDDLRHVVNTYFITISQDVSIQVQSVCYQSQTGHDPHVYNPMTIFNATIHGASWLAIDVNIDNSNQFWPSALGSYEVPHKIWTWLISRFDIYWTQIRRQTDKQSIFVYRLKNVIGKFKTIETVYQQTMKKIYFSAKDPIDFDADLEKMDPGHKHFFQIYMICETEN